VLSAAAWLGGAAAAEELNVFAAASLSDALEELAPAYAAASGRTLRLNLGASSDLARQIRAGASADVFFSADAAQMDVVHQAGLVRRAERVELLSNQLAVIVPASAERAPATAAELASLRRIAIADPEAVPAGVYARAWLTSLGLWDALKDRLVPTLNVRAALAAVSAGHADAAIVYHTDAALARRVRLAFAVPREQGPRIVYVLAPLATSKRRPGATDLVQFLRGAEAARVFAARGFVVLAGP
jgi:molybdate transport system substrate-binding protein